MNEPSDEIAVRSLAAAYSHAITRLDAEAAAAVYIDDGVLSAFFGPEIVGREKIADALRQTLAPLAFIVQTCASGLVEIDGDRARSSWSVIEWFQDKGKTELGCCFGLYEDQLARVPEGWRYVRRRFHPFYRGSVPASGKLYRPPEAFINTYAPWPFVGSGETVG